MKKDDRLVVRESTSIRVGRFLLERGFQLASGSSGEPTDKLADEDNLGVLYKDPEIKPKKYLFGLITIKPKRVFIGVIRFKHFKKDSENWHFETSGKKYQIIAERLANEMYNIFGVKIIVTLVTDYPLFESFWRKENCE